MKDLTFIIIVVFICAIAFEQGMGFRNQEYSKLIQLKQELFGRRTQAIQSQKELLRKINSQSDPAYVELVLMRVLGLVPEGQTKVFFKKP
jgi:hypothetical protein